MNPDPSKTAALPALVSLQRVWRRGMMASSFLKLAAAAGLLVLAAGVIDFQTASGPLGRRALQIIAAVVLLGLALREVLAWRKFSLASAARLADGASGKTGRPVQAALELSQQKDSAGSPALTRFLAGEAMKEAASTVQSLPAARRRPWADLGRRGLAALGVAAVLAGIWFAFNAQARVVGTRLLFPDRDVPPWSPLSFVLTPAVPEVIYGNDLELEVVIEGGKLPGPVRLLTRSPDGTVREWAAFQANASRFGRKLEKITGPVDVAFAAGPARSAWHAVKLVLQPRLEGVTLRLEPPAYSGLPPRDFAAGTGEISGLAGTKVILQALSNRPLSGGSAVITPAATGGKTPASGVAEGQPEGARGLKFEWVLRHTAQVALTIRDVQGTASATPLMLEQKLIPDRPPLVELHSPAAEVLATAETRIPLQARVEDDLGLNRVEWMRTLEGFRDRSKLIAQAPPDKNLEIGEELDLATLGVVPGQTLEVSLQAQDRNPSLMGVGNSAVGRIRIITAEEYTTLIRSRTTLEEFTGRYQVLREALKEARDSLEALKSAEPQDQEAARDAAAQAQKAAAEIFEKVAADFKAFDTDAALSAIAAQTAAALRLNESGLSGKPGAEAAGLAPEMLERLGGADKQLADAAEEAGKFAAVGRILEAAAMIRVVHDEQKEIATGLAELSMELQLGKTGSITKLEGLVEWQEANRRRMESFETSLEAAIGALPAEFAAMGQDAAAFLEEARRLKILTNLREAVKAGQDDKAADAAVEAVQAFHGLESLLQGPTAMAATCRSGSNQFSVPPSMSETLRQMMEGMCQRQGVGRSNRPGKGAGQGSGGGPDDGFAVAGKAAQNTPVFGPSRLQVNQLRAGLAGGQGDGKGKGRGRGTGQGASAESMVETDATRRAARRQIPPEAVPARYRDAVRRFYAEPEAGPVPVSTPTPPAPEKP